MQITISEDEASAMLLLKKMLLTAGTPVPEFLYWHAARHVNVHHESPNVDFVATLRERAETLQHIQTLLGIRR